MRKNLLVVGFFLLIGMGLVYASSVTVSVQMDDGWNLVYGFPNVNAINGGDIPKENIKAIYTFIPTIQEYAMVYP
jgi:hypothetical protein